MFPDMIGRSIDAKEAEGESRPGDGGWRMADGE